MRMTTIIENHRDRRHPMPRLGKNENGIFTLVLLAVAQHCRFFQAPETQVALNHETIGYFGVIAVIFTIASVF
jgi:hypothetical protein